MRTSITARWTAALAVLAIALPTACSDVGDSTALPGSPEASVPGDATSSDDVASGSGSTSEASTGSSGGDATVGSSGEAGDAQSGGSGEEDTGSPGTPDAESTPDTGAADSSPADAGVPDAGSADAGADAGAPDTGAPDATVADSGVNDSGGADATAADTGAPDTGSGGNSPTACTAAPCAASGSNSVQCVDSPTSDGVCTPTEAALVAYDIAQGNLGADGQLKPYVSLSNSGSCYTCLNAKACLDDDQLDVGNECSDAQDLTGGAAGSGVGLCMATLGCIFRTDCQGAGGIAGTSAMVSQENVQLCYCGGNNAGGACQTAGAATNGLCVQQEAAGFGFAFTDNKDILANYGAQPLPSGIANAILQCAVSNGCSLCK